MNAITNRTKNSLKIYLLAVVCAFSSVVAFSSCSYATDVNINATPTGSGQVCIDGYSLVDLQQVCGLIQNTTADKVGTVGSIGPLISGTYYSDTVISLEFTLYRNNNSQSTHAVVNGVQNNSSNEWDMIGYDYSNLDTNTGKLTLLFKNRTNGNNFNVLLKGNNGGFIFALQPGDRVAGINYTIFAISNANAGTDSIVNAINSQPNYSNNLNTINNNINSVNNNLNQVNNSINQSNQDANDRYEDEKDTINTNGENASDLWGETTFTLNFTDPFTTLWNLFTDAQCVDITTLANLLNVPSHSTICSPWSARLRQIFTPCFNLFAVFFAIGFFIRWLSGGTGLVSGTPSTDSVASVARDDWYERHGF